MENAGSGLRKWCQLLSLAHSGSTRQTKNGTTWSRKPGLSLGSPRGSPLWEGHCRSQLCRDRFLRGVVERGGDVTSRTKASTFLKGQAHPGSAVGDSSFLHGQSFLDVPKGNLQANLTPQCLCRLVGSRVLVPTLWGQSQP